MLEKGAFTLAAIAVCISLFIILIGLPFMLAATLDGRLQGLVGIVAGCAIVAVQIWMIMRAIGHGVQGGWDRIALLVGSLAPCILLMIVITQ